MTPSTLLATAEQEAAEAEAELAEQPVQSQPGDQGIATQEEDKESGPWDRGATQKEIKTAHDVLRNLRDNVREMGAEAVVDALIQIVDVHPEFVTPTAFPGGSDEVYRTSTMIGQICSYLARGCPKIELSSGDVVYLWKNKKTWTRRGVAVRAEGKSLGPLASFFADGAKAAVIVNFQHFRFLNTQQKVAALYHALRGLDRHGNPLPPQWAGHYDELELFGTGTWQEDVSLRNSIERSQDRQLAFALSPLEGE